MRYLLLRKMVPRSGTFCETLSISMGAFHHFPQISFFGLVPPPPPIQVLPHGLPHPPEIKIVAPRGHYLQTVRYSPKLSFSLFFFQLQTVTARNHATTQMVRTVVTKTTAKSRRQRRQRTHFTSQQASGAGGELREESVPPDMSTREEIAGVDEPYRTQSPSEYTKCLRSLAMIITMLHESSQSVFYGTFANTKCFRTYSKSSKSLRNCTKSVTLYLRYICDSY